eukprot:COSAG04_NODE_2697_length_3716_cov_5.217307_1_plen_409_part_10
MPPARRSVSFSVEDDGGGQAEKATPRQLDGTLQAPAAATPLPADALGVLSLLSSPGATPRRGDDAEMAAKRARLAELQLQFAAERKEKEAAERQLVQAVRAHTERRTPRKRRSSPAAPSTQHAVELETLRAELEAERVRRTDAEKARLEQARSDVASPDAESRTSPRALAARDAEAEKAAAVAAKELSWAKQSAAVEEERLQKEVNLLRESLAETAKQLAEEKAARAAAEEKLADDEEEQTALHVEVESLRAESHRLSEQLQENQQQLDESGAEARKLGTELGKRLRLLDNERAETARVAEELQKKRSQIEDAQAEAEAVRDEVEATRARLKEATAGALTIRDELRSTQAQLEESRNEARAVGKKLARLQDIDGVRQAQLSASLLKKWIHRHIHVHFSVWRRNAREGRT